MPSTTVHQRLKPAPKQDTLPSLRKSIRVRQTTAHPPPPLLREHTLTQKYDFVRSSSHHSRNSSDDGDDDYEEHYAQPPKKKAKRNRKERTASQTTVTQNWRNYVPTYEPEDWAGLIDDGEPDLSHVDERPATARTADTSNPTTADLQRCEASQTSSAQRAFGLGGTYDYAEHLLSITSSGRSSKALHAVSSDVESASTRPTSAGSATAFTTPRKVRRSVVPSSQTPSSLQLSRHTDHRSEIYQQSPLKERSSNITPSKRSIIAYPERSPGQTQKLFETLTQGTRDDGIVDAAWNAKIGSTPRKLAKSVNRSLQRATTIQDSQDDDLEFFYNEPPNAVRHTQEQEQEQKAASSDGGPTRTLKRTTTVQESQAESDIEDLEATRSLKPTATVQESQAESEVEDLEVEWQQCSYDPRFQQTYDPVMAALDRDAARFGRSDTQFTAQLESEESGDNASPDTQFVMSTQLEHSQSRDGSVELGSGSASREEAGSSRLSFSGLESDLTKKNPCEERPLGQPSERSSEEEDDELPQSATTAVITQERYGDDVQLSPYLRALDRDAHTGDVLPDSPASSLRSQLFVDAESLPKQRDQPELNQSQISTVMPTQHSRPSSAHGHYYAAPTMPINTLSSSPFPLPPHDSSDVYAGIETQDFSLPPPPPLSSQYRQSLGTSV